MDCMQKQNFCLGAGILEQPSSSGKGTEQAGNPPMSPTVPSILAAKSAPLKPVAEQATAKGESSTPGAVKPGELQLCAP